MGILNKLFKKSNKQKDITNNKQEENAVNVQGEKHKNTLLEDIHTSSDWIVKALNYSGYKADYSLESMREIDRFFDEQSSATGRLAKNTGSILFALGAYIGETAIKLYGGEWITDDKDKEGVVNVSVKLAGRTVIWPVIRCMKRYDLGEEESIYAYMYSLQYLRSK